MSAIGKVHHDLDTSIETRFNFYCIWASQVEHIAPEPASIVNIIYHYLCGDVHKEEFLVYVVIFGDIYCLLFVHVIF